MDRKVEIMMVLRKAQNMKKLWYHKAQINVGAAAVCKRHKKHHTEGGQCKVMYVRS